MTVVDISTAALLHEVLDFYKELRPKVDGIHYGWYAEIPYDGYILKIRYSNMLNIHDDLHNKLTIEIGLPK